MAERGISSDDLADRLLQAKGFRNILVHEYIDIDPELLWAHLQEGLGDLWPFAHALEAWLRAAEESDGET